jgi:PAS domain S-box-containing protein
VGTSSIVRDISQRKRTEDEGRKSPGYARSLFEASQDPLVTIDPLGKITDVNRATEIATGVGRKKLIGSGFSDYFTEPDKAREACTQALKTGSVTDHPLAIRHVSGKITNVLYNASVYLDGAGNIQGVFASARDITDRKKEEEQLKKRSDYLRSLIEVSQDPLVMINPDGKITDVNKTTEEITGVARDKLIGSDFSDYFTEPDKAREGYKKAFSQGSVTDYPLAIRHTTGRISNVLYNGTVYEDEHGNVQGVSGAARDITAAKRAEDDFKRASSYARSLFDVSLDPLVTISTDGKITDVNKATEKVTGLKRERLVGSDFSDYFTDPESAREAYRKAFQDGTVKDYPLAIRDVVGHITDVVYNATVYRDEAGRVQGVFAAARDVTERKVADEAIKKTSDELSRSNTDLEQFAYAASHDLKEPLRMVSSYVKLIEEKYKGKLDDKGDKYITYAVEGSQRMGKLVDGLLEFSKFSSQTQESKRLSLTETLNEALSNLQTAITEGKAEVTHDELPDVMGDHVQLVHVLQNLVANAIKFHSASPPKIHVSATRTGDEWTVSVKDNGIGVEPQYRDQLFVLFRRLHTRNEYEGTGIGLAVCKRVIERHGGHIWVDSEPGNGSTFSFTLHAVPLQELR